MSQYILFAGEDYYPQLPMQDFVACWYDDDDEAAMVRVPSLLKASKLKPMPTEWVQLLSIPETMDTMEMVRVWRLDEVDRLWQA